MKLIRNVVFDKSARESLLTGMEIVYRAVSSTLGPRSRTVAVDQYPDQDISPSILRDGVSVARAINLPNPAEDMGARLLKAASQKTVNDVGDGTTLTTILAYHLVLEANKAVAAGANPMSIKREIEESAKLAVASLQGLASPLTTNKEKESVATISSSDPELGKLITQALLKVGTDGVISVEEGTFVTEVEYKQGLEIARGYLSPAFITDTKRAESVLEEPYILITDKKINYPHQLLPIVQKIASEGATKSLLVIAGEVIEEALAFLVINKIQHKLKVVAIQAPAYFQRRIEELGDIATTTGGLAFTEELGRDLESLEVSELGQASKVIVSQTKSVIIGGKGSTELINSQVEDLKEQVKLSAHQFEKDIKQERLAKLSGTVAIFKVGGVTDIEIKEKKERVLDALAATKAAIEEGIVAGGEISLYKLASQAAESAQERLSLGEGILIESLKAPFKKLLENSGIDYAVALQELAGKPYPFGIDVTTGEVKNLIKEGIIDPVKVLRNSIENAVSVATLSLTTNTLVTDITPDEDQGL